MAQERMVPETNVAAEPTDQQPRRRTGCWLGAIAVLLVIVAAGSVLWPEVKAAREAARTASCRNMVVQFGIALHNYHDAQGRFPAAYLADQQGRPMHSWRVLLLPMIEEQRNYEKYKFDEPWDSPHNLTLADRPKPALAPRNYTCPSDWAAGKDDTSDVLIVGPGTAFDGPRAITTKDITDGVSHTVLGGEMSESGIHWMEPRDLNVKQMSFKINDQIQVGLRSNHPGGANVEFADGSARFLSNEIDPEVLKSLTTIDGGEPFNYGDLDPQPPTPTPTPNP
jgi:prepilin-type processing-associated H-X9-DG protein